MRKGYLFVTLLIALGGSAFAQVYEITAFNTDVVAAIDTARPKPLARKLLGNTWLD